MDISELRAQWCAFNRGRRVEDAISKDDLQDVSTLYMACADDDHITEMWQIMGDEVHKVFINANETVFEFDEEFLQIGGKLLFTYTHDCADGDPHCQSGEYLHCLTIVM